MNGAETFWRKTDRGVELRVRLTPKSSRDAIDGVERLADGSTVLKARVRAVPEAGKANTALIALLANALGVAKSRFVLSAGAGARIKTVMLEDGAGIAAQLGRLAGGGRAARRQG